MDVPVEKNKEYIVEITDYGHEGEGIAKIENFTIFIPVAMKGETVKIKVVKVNRTYAFGKVMEIIQQAKARRKEDCQTYPRCGGCQLRHMSYEETLLLKQGQVQNLVNKSLIQKITVNQTIGMEHPYHYRNKAQYPVGVQEGKIVAGVYAARSHDIIQMKSCEIQMPIAENITKHIVQFMQENNISAYQEKTQTGAIRHIVIKVGMSTKEVMCILVTKERNVPRQEKLVESLRNTFPEIKTIVKNINTKNTNVILGNENVVLYGNGYIRDKLGGFTFSISPMSFYQINPQQTEKLYQKALEFAGITKNDIVLDLYCGIGTIASFASLHAKHVYGIEIIEQAIEDAKKNAKENGIKNVTFYCGDVEQILDKIVAENRVKPNIIFVDPPRRGLDLHTIQNMINYKSQKIIYISCNPATLIRDLQQLEEYYQIQKIQPLDMFPFTSHVEVCTLLELKNCQ